MSTFDFYDSLILLAVAIGTSLMGIAIGWWLKDRRSSNALVSEARARAFLSRLHDLATTLADELSKHTTRIEEVGHELVNPNATTRRAQPEAIILDSISQMVMSNKRLHNKLSSAEHQLQEQARKIDFHLAEARTDALTQLPNRRAFDDELESRMARRHADGKPIAILFIDLDHLKRINEDYGHEAGDRLLRHVGDVLTATMRDRDMVVRYSGEQYAVILTETALPEAIRAADRAIRAIRESKCKFEGKELHITASAGIAEVGAGDDSRTLCRRADAALNAAMEAGRNTGYFHDGRTCHPILNELNLAPQPTPREVDNVSRRHAVYAQYVAALGVDARTDVLTGLPNRRAFSDELRRRVTEAKKHHRPLSLMLVGVDNLGQLSAFEGQDSVDQVLRKVAQVLCAVVRDADLVTRFGWEEFAVILPNTKYDDARKAHHRAQAALAACMQELQNVTISSGLAELSEEDDSGTLAKTAESALSKAKLAGGNCSHVAREHECANID